jgi:diaminohydroxyphosphoribosylaminopyrimidine deaminase/5-amino-6-(5-phosphoribosylamino)uracil reductase
VVLSADAEGRIDVSAWVQYLGEQAFNEIMVEAGPTLSGALLKGGWVDRLIIYQAPKLLGDDARAMAAMSFSALTEAPEFEINEVTRIGADLRIIAAPKV